MPVWNAHSLSCASNAHCSVTLHELYYPRIIVSLLCARCVGHMMPGSSQLKHWPASLNVATRRSLSAFVSLELLVSP